MAAAENALIEASSDGVCVRVGAGNSALWRPPADRASRLGPRRSATTA
jgi:hypothetical protein